jgi:hypothetical protein
MAAAEKNRSDLAYNDQEYYGQRQRHNRRMSHAELRCAVKISSTGNHTFTIYIG